MGDKPLSQAVEAFIETTHSLSEADLEHPWAWGDYDEGVRHAFFRTYEELNEMQVAVNDERAGSVNPITTAQRILAQHHLAYRDLLAHLLGLTEEQVEQHPGGEEWSIGTAVQHIISAERTFFAIINHALVRARSGDIEPQEISDEEWDEFWAGDPFDSLKEKGTFSEVLAYYGALHTRIQQTFSTITNAELATPSIFWESSPMPIDFRLHRFDSHLRQHTVQVEKTIDALNFPTGEAKRLSRLVYNALASVEGALIGADETVAEARQALADGITRRTAEITDATT